MLNCSLDIVKMYLEVCRLQSQETKQDTQTCFYSSCDLDLDPITLIYKSDLDILKMYLCTKNKVAGSGLSKLEPKQDRVTDTTQTHTQM